jgi:drug/metabolite transporter (DMT)-like permease
MVPLGLTFGAMSGLYLAAVKATTAANAIFLQCSATFWMVPLGLLLLRERPDRRSMAGIGLATVGIAAIVLYGRDGRTGEGQGIALGLASGLAYAIVVVGLRGLRDLDPIWLSGVNNLAGALTLGAWIILTRGPIARPDASQAVMLVGFGVIQMAIPYVLFARGLRAIPVAEAGLIGLLEPVLNPIWVVLLHGERPADASIIGGLFLLSGIACRYLPGRSDLKAAVEEVADGRQILLGRGRVDQDDAVPLSDQAAVGQLGKGGQGGGPLGRPGEPPFAPLVADHVADRVVGDGQSAAAGLANDPQDVDMPDIPGDVQARGDRLAGG